MIQIMEKLHFTPIGHPTYLAASSWLSWDFFVCVFIYICDFFSLLYLEET